MSRISEGIPQVVAIASVSASGKLSMAKAVRQHLGIAEEGPLYLDAGDEIRLTTEAGAGTELAVTKRRIELPEGVLRTLGIDGGALLGLVQRPDALALKRVEIVERASTWARLVDLETRYAIARTAETNPMPEELLPRLQEQYGDLALRYDVIAYLRGRQTFAAWRARRLLERAGPADEALRGALIAQRAAAQEEDGSWQGQVTLTARALRELAALGLTQEDEAVRRGADWLLERPQSAHNPGMFFASDELVAEQARIVADRQQGKGGRFRALKASEKKRVAAGDELIRAPCGPRIMWPNALALEALLALGYEGHERIQAALETMAYPHDWCECGYQHGRSDWRHSDPPTVDEIAAFEASCIAEYRYGGIKSAEELARADLAHSPFNHPRIACEPSAAGDVYPLRMNEHFQGCEVITTRALGQVREARMRRYAEAHLWRFASRQQPPDGRFPEDRYGSGLTPAGLLALFARYDHPASKVAIMRALPWIVEAQNEDGSWGEGGGKDVATCATLSALTSVGGLLPARVVP